MRVDSSSLRVFLGDPSWYMWKTCKQELGLPSRQMSFSFDETKAVMGWFFLKHARVKKRSFNDCIVRYEVVRSTNPTTLPYIMTGAAILKLKDRPSRSTLYRRGLKASGLYNMGDVMEFLR